MQQLLLREVSKGPKILPSQQLGAAVATWPGATGLLASVTADDMAHKGELSFLKFDYILKLQTFERNF
ncbi:hypothetical protein PV326_002269 [Microctonus aethiopoides]|nr:hypothetical protein PV326_002269 [Microctonus aethiopoides]